MLTSCVHVHKALAVAVLDVKRQDSLEAVHVTQYFADSLSVFKLIGPYFLKFGPGRPWKSFCSHLQADVFALNSAISPALGAGLLLQHIESLKLSSVWFSVFGWSLNDALWHRSNVVLLPWYLFRIWINLMSCAWKVLPCQGTCAKEGREGPVYWEHDPKMASDMERLFLTFQLRQALLILLGAQGARPNLKKTIIFKTYVLHQESIAAYWCVL